MDHQLFIFNTLTKNKSLFIPINPNQVKLYVCGMTVYDYCHVGHARVLVVFDMVYRWLLQLGYQVTYVRNITDIDDKIIARAKERNTTIMELTQQYINYMHEDSKALNITPPTFEPRATDYIPQMQNMIDQLMLKGFAYQANQGDIHFAIRQFPFYGQLSGKNIDELQAGERVTIDTEKKDPLDFVLWKKAKPNEPKDAIWQSPWGDGRPGWHIECSAMSTAILGDHFDIHGGGADLQFPHHENEIAQSECALGLADHRSGHWVNYWMHNGFVNINDEKMSKSLGNFFTIREVLQHYSGDVIRFFILKAHYRSPLNYSQDNLNDAKAGLERLYRPLQDFELPDNSSIDWNEPIPATFLKAMNDDFNTPLAISALHELTNQINLHPDRLDLKSQLFLLLKALGLLSQTAKDFFQSSAVDATQIDIQIKERHLAKQQKDFAKADAIRANLLSQGIVLEDKNTGETTWRKV